MKLRSLLYQPLPFYGSFEETYYKNKCASCQNTLIYDKDHLPSFILERDSDYLKRFFQIKLIDIHTGADILTITPSYTPTIVTFIDQDNIVKDQIFFNEPTIDTIPCGLYRLKITDFTNTWYSEVYRVVDIDTTNLSHNKLKWRNDCGLNDIMYSDFPEFYFGAYLEDITKICEPEYEFELTVQKNNLGKEKPKFQSMKKMYRLDTGLIPEYLVDAFNFMRIHNDIRVFPKGENESTYDFGVEEFNTSNPQWDNFGCLTNIEFRFVRDLSVIKTNCCTTDKLTCPDVSQEILYLNSSVCYLEDPNTMVIGDAFYMHTECDPSEVTSNIPCISITEGNAQVGKIWTWNGSCFDFSDPTPYVTYYPNPITQPGVTKIAWFTGTGVGYMLIPEISIVTTAPGVIDLFVTYIPDNFYAIISESYDGGLTWEYGGEYNKTQIESGVYLGGSGTYLYRVVIRNFNCVLATEYIEHTF